MNRLTVLVAEDEARLSELLVRILNQEGYKVLAAADGHTALEILGDNQVDILLTDLKMPGMDGLTLLERTKDIDPGIEVILMTAHATLDTAVNALRNGARDYLLKPFDLDELIASVRKAALLVAGGETASSFQSSPETFGLVAKSAGMKALMRMIHKVSGSQATVLIQGETGVGKELVAQAIHTAGDRREKPFIRVNCSALPETLLESELFGYEKGAFTGAGGQKPGRFELADGGTVFLDEIGELSPLLQVKLLRVLQHKAFERLGGTTTLTVDVRIITATNRDLEQMVAAGTFREDLFYRLNVIPLTVPPLRERLEDLAELIEVIIRHLTPPGAPAKQFSPEALRVLERYRWPGNVRELENLIERLLVISEGRMIGHSELPVKLQTGAVWKPGEALDTAVDQAEEAAIRKALLETDNHITRSAERLGISRRSLHRKINKYSIEPERK